MTKIAVILSGCGYLDGAEIRESVLTLLALDKYGAETAIFAPDIPQADVIDHATGKVTGENRNALTEAARIARGKIQSLDYLSAHDFDALILPGGFGMANNLSNLATQGKDITVLPSVKRIIQQFHEQKKNIGAICISPAIVTAALETPITVTIGDDSENIIAALGGIHQTCNAQEIYIDETNHIISTPAYMLSAPLHHIAEGIDAVVKATID